MILIHGGGSWGAELQPFTEAMAAYGPVTAPDLVGHGGRPVPDDFSIKGFAEDVLAGMDRAGVEKEFLIGYSSGGSIALYLARHHPERVRGAVAIGTKHVFDEETAAHWKRLSDPEHHNRTGRAALLERVNGPNWQNVCHTNARMWGRLPLEPPLAESEFGKIAVPVLLINSNRDPIVSWEETLAHGKLIPECQLVMFYGFAHPITSVPVHSVAQTISEWMKKINRP